MKFTYKTNGVCSTNIILDIEDDVIKSVHYENGCNGNLQGISRLVTGMTSDEVITKLSGIRCGFKSTSCPDQLAKALKEYKSQKGE